MKYINVFPNFVNNIVRENKKNRCPGWENAERGYCLEGSKSVVGLSGEKRLGGMS